MLTMGQAMYMWGRKHMGISLPFSQFCHKPITALKK